MDDKSKEVEPMEVYRESAKGKFFRPVADRNLLYFAALGTASPRKLNYNGKSRSEGGGVKGNL